MEEKENIRQVVESNLRSVTQSCKGGVPFDRLERDYRDLLGTVIPYRNLGYSSLQDLIVSMPDVIRIARNKSGQMVVEGVADESTEHIAKMISKQKDNRSRKPVQKYRMQPRLFRMQPSRSVSSRDSFSHARRYPVQPRNVRPEETRQPSPRDYSRKPVSQVTKPTQLRSFNQKSPNKQVQIMSSNKAQYEVPPRFQRQHESPQFNKAREYDQPPEESRVTIRPSEDRPEAIRPPQFKPANIWPPEKGPSVIRPPVESTTPPAAYPPNLLPPFEMSPSKKIPSPKPKTVKSPRRTMPPPPLPIANLTAKGFIEEYAATHGLEYSYHTRAIGQKKKNYISELTLAGKKFKSYPDEKPTEAKAEEVAASRAREEIEQRAKETVYEETSCETAEDMNILMSRIEEIVADKPNGVFNSHCEDVYKMKYKQKLPDAWLSYVKEHLSGVVEIETLDRLNSPKDTCILRFHKESSGTTSPTSTSSRLSNPLDDDLVSELNSSVSNISLHGAPVSCILDKPQCDVLVTFIEDATHIAVRDLDNEDYFFDFCNMMISFYQTHHYPVQQIVTDKLYLVREQENCQRVIIKNIQGDQVNCHFVDVGETSILNIADLQELGPAFVSLRHQAANISLAGLEDYNELISIESLCSNLLDKSLVAKTNRDENNIVTSAVLYDTSEDNFDININELLKDQAISDALAFDMPQSGSTIMCFVTYVSPEGDVFLRINRPHIHLLEEEIEKLSPKFEDCIADPSPKQLFMEKMYVAKYIDGLWYRARLMTIDTDATEVEVFYVDYGNTSFVSLNSICELEPISWAMATLPFQAVPCLLSEIPLNWRWTEDAVKKFYELAPENDLLIVKVDQPANENLPAQVSLYKRNESSVIISINQTLRYSKELFVEEEIDQAAASSGRPNTLPSDSGFLSRYIPDVAVPAEVHMAKRHTFDTSPYQCIWAPTPEGDNEPFIAQGDTVPSAVIPKIGVYFEVYIPWVANPWNFVVQPLATSKDLEILQDKMFEFYSNEDNFCELPLCVLKLDEVYAVLHTDKVWYRARLKQIIQEEPVVATVHFVDYGDFSTVETPNIQTLYSQFKVLPCQAIKASLTGIKPHSEDWEHEQCFAFCKLISEKKMISVIVNKHKSNELDFGFSSIELNLIDTSEPENDIVIHEELIKNDLALRA